MQSLKLVTVGFAVKPDSLCGVFVCTSQAGGVGRAMGKRAFAGSDTKPSASTEEAAKIKNRSEFVHAEIFQGFVR